MCGLVFALNAQSAQQSLVTFNVGDVSEAGEVGLQQNTQQAKEAVQGSVQSSTQNAAQSTVQNAVQGQVQVQPPSPLQEPALQKPPVTAEFVEPQNNNSPVRALTKAAIQNSGLAGFSAGNINPTNNITPAPITVAEQAPVKPAVEEVIISQPAIRSPIIAAQNRRVIKSLVNFDVAGGQIDAPDQTAQAVTEPAPSGLSIEMPSGQMQAQVQVPVQVPVQAPSTQLANVNDASKTSESLAVQAMQPVQPIQSVQALQRVNLAPEVPSNNAPKQTAFALTVQIAPGLVETPEPDTADMNAPDAQTMTAQTLLDVAPKPEAPQVVEQTVESVQLASTAQSDATDGVLSAVPRQVPAEAANIKPFELSVQIQPGLVEMPELPQTALQEALPDASNAPQVKAPVNTPVQLTVKAIEMPEPVQIAKTQQSLVNEAVETAEAVEVLPAQALPLPKAVSVNDRSAGILVLESRSEEAYSDLLTVPLNKPSSKPSNTALDNSVQDSATQYSLNDTLETPPPQVAAATKGPPLERNSAVADAQAQAQQNTKVAQVAKRADGLPTFKYETQMIQGNTQASGPQTGIVLTEEDIAAINAATSEFDAIDLPIFDTTMPVIDSGIARLQLDEWFNRLAKAPLAHPQVIAAQFGEQEALSTISEAQANNYPQVSVGLSADSQTSVRDGEKISSVQGLEASNALRMNPNLSIKQLVFDGGATKSRITAAKSRSSAASSRRASTEIDVALRAADTLIELAKLQEQLEAARNNLDEVSRLRDMIRERVSIGRDSPSEMLQMNTRVFEARNQVVRLQGFRAEAGARHEETFGEPPVVLAFPDVFAPIPMSVESGVDMAIRFNPDIVNARTLVDVALAEHQAAKRDGMPRVEVEARVNAYDTTRTGSDFYDTFMGVTVSHSLFDGGRQNAVEDRSAKSVERTRAQSQQTMADVEFAIKRAYANRKSLIPRYKSLQAQLDQKLKTRQAYEAQFIAGRRPLNDLITAQQQVLDAALTVVETKAELHRQHFTILALMGDLIDKN